MKDLNALHLDLDHTQGVSHFLNVDFLLLLFFFIGKYVLNEMKKIEQKLSNYSTCQSRLSGYFGKFTVDNSTDGLCAIDNSNKMQVCDVCIILISVLLLNHKISKFYFCQRETPAVVLVV